MAIPFISDILDGVKWLIDFFMNKAPKPLQIIFFLLMLISFSFLITFFFHLSGVHCDNDGEIKKVSPLKIFKNIKIAFIDADDVYNETSYIPDPITFLSIPATSCRKPVCLHNGEYFWESDSSCDNETIIYPYLISRLKSSRCSLCIGDVNYTRIDSSIGSEYFYLCFADAFPFDSDDMNWYQSWTCDEDRCSPPPSYYYEYDTGSYDCFDLDVCGVNQTNFTLVSELDQELKNADAELMYPTTNDQDYRNMLLFECDRSFKPQLTIYSIPIFDYKVWLLMIVISVLFYFLINVVKIKQNK